MQKYLWGFIAIAAIGGWIATLFVIDSSSDLGDRLRKSEGKLSGIDNRLTQVEGNFSRYGEAMKSLEKIVENINSAQDDLAGLMQQASANQNDLMPLRKSIAAQNATLVSLTRRLQINESSIADLLRETESMKKELIRLQSGIQRKRKLTVRPRTTTPGNIQKSQRDTEPKSTVKPLETSKTARPQSGDIVADAKERFRAIDRNSDNKIDRVEFRVEKVMAFDLVDVNRDGKISADETLLSPDVLQKLDLDKDGEISMREFIDSKFFTVIDTNRDGFVTFEEYVSLLRGSVP